MALDIKKFVARFVEEARDHVARLGDGLDALERDPADRENINTIFRSAHTIKGSCGNLGFLALSGLGAAVEKAVKEADLDKARGSFGNLEAEYGKVVAMIDRL